MDTCPTSIADIPPAIFPKDDELIYGIQNDELVQIEFHAKGGIRSAETALKEHGYEQILLFMKFSQKYTTTVNDGISPSALTSNIRRPSALTQ